MATERENGRGAALCGADCAGCPHREKCRGCAGTGGRPFGGSCVAAERIRRDGADAFRAWKEKAAGEVNALGIPGLIVEDFALLPGFFVNLEYPLPSGQRVRLLEDGKIYLGCQVERPGNDRCYGLVLDEDFLLVCEYGCGGADPRLLLYRSRRGG